MRSALSGARSAEIAERGKKSKEEFDQRCADGDIHALLMREKMLHGNSSRRYWELFAQCQIEEAERAGTVSRVVVNGISVYSGTFADAVMESISELGNIVIQSGRTSK